MGILPIPAATFSSCRSHSVGGALVSSAPTKLRCSPTERTERTEPIAEKSLPQMSTDVHRLGGYGIPAIPTLPDSVYSVNSVGEQRTLSICVNL